MDILHSLIYLFPSTANEERKIDFVSSPNVTPALHVTLPPMKTMRFPLFRIFLILLVFANKYCQATKKFISTAVIMRVEDMTRFNDVLQCAVNVINAKRMLDTDISFIPNKYDFTISIDIHVSFNGNGSSPKDFQKIVRNRLLQRYKRFIHSARVVTSDSSGPDDSMAFLNFIESAALNKKRYDLILKLSSKSTRTLDEYATQCLCGTPSHVIAILTQFERKSNIDLIAPHGSLYTESATRAALHPAVRRSTIHNTSIDTLAKAYSTIFDMTIIIQRTPIFSVGGLSVWMRYQALYPKKLAAAYPALQELSKTYSGVESMSSVFDRLLPTLIVKHGGVLAEMIPAPVVLPLYFPQYHTIPENDRFHSVGFTEWTLLRPLPDYPGLLKPLSKARGGLDYYDLTRKDVRLKQAELATIGGVHGFVYYHFWFSGATAPPGHLVMQRIPELMLKDGKASRPFMFSWANEPWTRTWSGGSGDVLLSQEYGDRTDWAEHFLYLLKFFTHPKYIRVNDKPAFALYRIGHFGDKLRPILQFWNLLARQNGLRGIHFITTLGNFVTRDTNTYDLWRACPEIEGAFHFRPQLREPFPAEIRTASISDLTLPVRTTQYWGAYSNFDPRPRRPEANPARIDTKPALFHAELVQSFAAMTASTTRFVSPNLYFVTAWNEWNEQAVLEPDDKNEFGNLVALRGALQSVQARVFTV